MRNLGAVPATATAWQQQKERTSCGVWGVCVCVCVYHSRDLCLTAGRTHWPGHFQIFFAKKGEQESGGDGRLRILVGPQVTCERA